MLLLGVGSTEQASSLQRLLSHSAFSGILCDRDSAKPSRAGHSRIPTNLSDGTCGGSWPRKVEEARRGPPSCMVL
jgi:hypothetical protein